MRNDSKVNTLGDIISSYFHTQKRHNRSLERHSVLQTIEIVPSVWPAKVKVSEKQMLIKRGAL